MTGNTKRVENVNETNSWFYKKRSTKVTNLLLDWPGKKEDSNY